eukprot:XP_017951215.1 PREDICTED: carcinoembryonic antigen-related cell adhesion molecule 1-like [Xenopus tropicalis]
MDQQAWFHTEEQFFVLLEFLLLAVLHLEWGAGVRNKVFLLPLFLLQISFCFLFSLSVSLSAWMDGAHGIWVQLIPQYPVLNQSVTLSITGVTGTIRQFDWYKGSSVDTNTQIFSVIPSANSVTEGPQYFPRANWLPNGSLQISGLVPTDQGNYTVRIQTAESTVQATVSLPVYVPLTKPVIGTNNPRPEKYEEVVLTCPEANAEKIIWSRIAGSFPSGVTFNPSSRSMTIPRVTESHAGQYQCEVENPVSKNISDPYTLTVYCVCADPAGVLAGIICGSIVGAVLIICATFLLYKRFILPVRQAQTGQANSTTDSAETYENVICGTKGEHNAVEQPYMGLQHQQDQCYCKITGGTRKG